MRYWLMKNEPTCYGIDDLKRDGTYIWDGVRNYQARNLIRDDMKVGDMMLYYHSNASPTGVVGTGEITKGPFADPSQFKETSEYYDGKATKDSPRWFAVEVSFRSKFKEIVTLQELKDDPTFKKMLVIKKGMRLSVQPVSKKDFERIVKLGNA